ncbi:MAG: TolC family protein [Bacteroidota bacterium]
MKKIIVIHMLLCVAFGFGQAQKTYNIGIIADFQSLKTEPALEQLQNEIKSVVGEDAIIEFPLESRLVNNYDAQKATENYDQLLNNDTDIILAFGPVTSKLLEKQTSYPKPVILFGAINRDFSNLDFSKETSGIPNLTYLIDSQSYLEDFKKLKELTEFDTLGIAIEAPLMDVLPLKETFDKEFEILQAEYKLIPFSTTADITQNLEGIDAVYLAGGFFLTEDEISELADAFIQKGLPSFSANGTSDVNLGIMATNQSDESLDQFFRRISLTVEAYVTGASMADLPVYIEYTPRLTINYNTAEAVGVPIKYSLVGSTDFVGEMKNVKSEKDYTILDVIDGVLEQNLSLQSNQKDVELTVQDVRTAKSSYLPTLSAAASGTYVDPDLAEVSNGQNPEFSTAGAITLEQVLFSEAANANIAIQKKLQKAQEESFNASQLDAILDGTIAYFNILILKANTDIQLRNLDLTKANFRIAEQNFEAGQSGKSDLLRFRSEMAQNMQTMIEAINQLEQGYISLNQVLNNPLDMEIDVEDVALDEGVFKRYNYEQLTNLLDDPKLREPFVHFLTEEALRNAPEIKSLDYNLEAVERNIKLSGSGRFLPTVALQGSYNSTFNRSGAGSTAIPGFGGLVDNSYNASLSVSLPIFNQNTNNINQQIAIIQKDQLEINKDNTELAVDSNVRNGVLNLINQVANIELSTVSEETAKEALELTQTSYSEGAVNIVQLLDAQNNYLDAQLARVNAVYNFLINSLQLERSLGYYFLLKSETENEAFRQRFFEFLNTRN